MEIKTGKVGVDMSDGNYIKLHRKFLDWEWYGNINTKTVFLHLLLKANWKDGKLEGKVVKRGSLVTSLDDLSDKTGLTINEVRTAIKHLKLTNEITCKTSNKNTVITVVNYGLYQDLNNQVNNQITNKSQTINKPLTTIEEEKELEEEKESNSINYQGIIDSYNRICKSLPKASKLSEKRKAAIRARLRHYTVDEVTRVFETAESSKFLTGGNKRNWTATFDWLMCDANMAKVLDGNYNRERGNGYESGSGKGNGGGEGVLTGRYKSANETLEELFGEGGLEAGTDNEGYKDDNPFR